MTTEAVAGRFSRHGLNEWTRQYGPGLLVATVVIVTAQFLSDHCGVPAMLMALRAGHRVHREDGAPSRRGAARHAHQRRDAVALGAATIALVIGAVIAVILAVIALLGGGGDGALYKSWFHQWLVLDLFATLCGR